MILNQPLHILVSSKCEVTMWLELDVGLVQILLLTLSVGDHGYLVLKIPQEIGSEEGSLDGLWQAGLHPDAQGGAGGETVSVAGVLLDDPDLDPTLGVHPGGEHVGDHGSHQPPTNDQKVVVVLEVLNIWIVFGSALLDSYALSDPVKWMWLSNDREPHSSFLSRIFIPGLVTFIRPWGIVCNTSVVSILHDQMARLQFSIVAVEVVSYGIDYLPADARTRVRRLVDQLWDWGNPQGSPGFQP